MIEMKSLGENLDKAMDQALDYYVQLKKDEEPRYILVCDFQNWYLRDKNENQDHLFTLSEFVDNIGLFGFMTNRPKVVQASPVNAKAVEMIGEIFDLLKKSGYASDHAEYFLTRLVFCLFADDTGIFGDRNKFQAYLKERTSEDGSDLGMYMSRLFEVLNQHRDKRSKLLDSKTRSFPYINGALFERQIDLPEFDREMRQLLIKAGEFDWSKISPTIFGTMFQTVMDQDVRRTVGAHYTSEENILKVIKPLFLDELNREFDEINQTGDDSKKDRFVEFQNKLANLKFLDPACGGGNFLVIAYREIRRLEHKAIMKIYGYEGKRIDTDELSKVDVNQFYGIEIIPFSARVAEISLWMMDHLMNLELSKRYGLAFRRIPIKQKPNIEAKDALELDWNDMLPATECNYVFGNPPFSGARQMTDEQKEQTIQITKSANLDYVSNWFVKALKYAQHTFIQIAFVATNSIIQGEQVKLLWSQILKDGWEIFFAYKSFKWNSDSKGKAQVTVVIMGLSRNKDRKQLFEYDKEHNETQFIEKNPKHITPYLRVTNTEHVVVNQVSEPINGLPPIRMGSNPVDDGHYIFTESEKEEFLKSEPNAKKYIVPYYSGSDFLHNKKRYVLALQTITPNELRKLPMVMEKVDAVKQFRLQNKSKTTRKYAETPKEFYQTHIPKKPFLAIPQVSSENRKYVPMKFMKLPVITSIQLYHIEDASVALFGLLESKMHMLWLHSFSGKLETRLRYSANRVYNTFPVPEDYSPLKPHAQKILDLRKNYPDSTLADLYDPLTTPTDLKKAHQKLDREVEKLYRKEPFRSDDERLEFLLNEYQKMTSSQTTLG